MTAWTAAGVFVLFGLGAIAWMRWTARHTSLDQHIDQALALANAAPPCQCRGRLHDDTSGTFHSPTVCYPQREHIGGVR